MPGVAFGLIQDGKVVFAGGFGVRELGKPAQVDGDTLFMIASNTKALTTLMLAKLVDAKKLDVGHAGATSCRRSSSATPRRRAGAGQAPDLRVHRHAAAGLEWLFEFKDSTPDERDDDARRRCSRRAKFGELFQYSNPLAAAAGFIGGHVAFPKLELGAAYDEAMQTRVFEPLGMKSTTFDYAKAQRGDHASPHGVTIDGHPARDPMEENYDHFGADALSARRPRRHHPRSRRQLRRRRPLRPHHRQHHGSAALEAQNVSALKMARFYSDRRRTASGRSSSTTTRSLI